MPKFLLLYWIFQEYLCGLLAENLRERQVEHRREKDYMASMLNDLEKASALDSLIRKEYRLK